VKRLKKFGSKNSRSLFSQSFHNLFTNLFTLKTNQKVKRLSRFHFFVIFTQSFHNLFTCENKGSSTRGKTLKTTKIEKQQQKTTKKTVTTNLSDPEKKTTTMLYSDIERLIVRGEPLDKNTYHFIFRAEDSNLYEAHSSVSLSDKSSKKSFSFQYLIAGMFGEVKPIEHGKRKDFEKLAIAAFTKVQHRFTLKNGKWVGNDKERGIKPLEFEEHLRKNAIKESLDYGILARILAEVAASDGKIAREEMGFLSLFLPKEIGEVDDIIKASPLTTEELKQVKNQGVRESMIMLAWALSMSDGKLAKKEESRIVFFAKSFGLTKERATQLKLYAEQFLLDRAFEFHGAKGSLDQNDIKEIIELCQKLTIPKTEFEAIHERYQKRCQRQ